jgi:Kef-type K+ transport system membrane component KefB
VSGLTFIVLFLIFMSLSAIVPQALKRFYVPSVVAILLVGIAVGPHALNMVGHLSFFLRGYPEEQLYTVIDAFGLLGLVFLMTLAGMEVNLPMLLLEKKAVAFLTVLTLPSRPRRDMRSTPISCRTTRSENGSTPRCSPPTRWASSFRSSVS